MKVAGEGECWMEKANDGGEWKLVCSVVGKVLKGPNSSPPGFSCACPPP